MIYEVQIRFDIDDSDFIKPPRNNDEVANLVKAMLKHEADLPDKGQIVIFQENVGKIYNFKALR